jgi:tartrate-resistant acid phosphatase type 5
VVSVGDNFYKGAEYDYDGVMSAQDSKWETLWNQMYKGILGRVPWFSTLGNHDWYGNVETQIQYSQYNPRWVIPGFLYSKIVYFGPGGQYRAAFIMIDTDLLANGYHGDTNPLMRENFKRLGWTPQNRMLEQQFSWIQQTLERYKDFDYIFVSGHHPLETCPTRETWYMPKLKELLLRYRVSIYIFGHVHGLHLAQRDQTVFLMSGAGSRTEGVCPGSSGWAPDSYSYGYSLIKVFGSQGGFTMTFLNEKNQVLGSFQGYARNASAHT